MRKETQETPSLSSKSKYEKYTSILSPGNEPESEWEFKKGQIKKKNYTKSRKLLAEK